MTNTIGELIRARRSALGHNQKAAASKMGVTQSTVSDWESGGVPKDDYYARVADYLGIHVDDVVVAAYYTRVRQAGSSSEVAEVLSQLADGLAEMRLELDRLVARLDAAGL